MSSISSLSAGAAWGSPGWQHLYIAGAGLLVCALVASVCLLSFQKSKIGQKSGIATFLRFAYATFLKPHAKGGEGQQAALESFYKGQVSRTG